MHPTSTAWKENQTRPLTGEAFVELSYSITDPDLHIEELLHNGDLDSVAQSEKIVDQQMRQMAAFATLEQDLWLLDGRQITVPETFLETRPFGGYISHQLCGRDGVFEKPPSIDLVFREAASILPGVTITWGTAFGDYPLAFDVIAYQENGQEIGRKHITDNQDMVSIVWFEMREVAQVRIEILSWCAPKRRARIERLFLGINKIYSKDNLFSFSSEHSIDPVSAQLPKYEISFEIDNRADDFNPLNEDGLSKYMMERQEIFARYGFRDKERNTVEWVPGGQYFLSEWTAPQNGLSASFRARDILSFLGGIYHKGEYSAAGVTLADLAQSVLRDALPEHLGRREDRWNIDESLDRIITHSPLPLVSSAECLQLIANAAGASIYFDRAGILHIAPLASYQGPPDVQFSSDRCYTRPEIELDKPLKQVQVSMYGWQIDEAETTLYDEVLPLEFGQNTFTIEYNNAATETALRAGSSHQVEAELFARSATVSIYRRANDPAECRLVIVGKTIKPTETIISIANSDRGETLPLRNILITDITRARQVGQWVKARYQNRKSFSLDWRVDPAHDVADFAALGEEGTDRLVRVLSTDFRFNGAFRGRSKGVIVA